MGDLFSELGASLNPAAAMEKKEIGIQRAIDHADKEVEKWSDKAYRLFLQYCASVDELKTEDARIYAEAKGLEIPPTKRAWGAIPLRAVKNGLIFRKGVVSAANIKCHMGFTTLWGVNKDKIISIDNQTIAPTIE